MTDEGYRALTEFFRQARRSTCPLRARDAGDFLWYFG